MREKAYKTSEFKKVIRPQLKSDEFTFWQRAMMRRFHPQAVVLDSIAAIWSVYFLWNQNWIAALACIVVSRAIGTALSLDMNYSAFRQQTLGKVALLHLDPINISIQTIGLIPFVYGLWAHSTPFILGGVSLVVLGHFRGWSKVIKY